MVVTGLYSDKADKQITQVIVVGVSIDWVPDNEWLLADVVE